MSRIAIIEFHDGKQTVVNHGNTDDASMVEYAIKTFGPAHKIKKITTCTEDAVYLNEAPIVTWLKTVKRITS